jgi:hypothetical protein
MGLGATVAEFIGARLVLETAAKRYVDRQIDVIVPGESPGSLEQVNALQGSGRYALGRE